jgi:hypothetical protein
LRSAGAEKSQSHPGLLKYIFPSGAARLVRT